MNVSVQTSDNTHVIVVEVADMANENVFTGRFLFKFCVTHHLMMFKATDRWSLRLNLQQLRPCRCERRLTGTWDYFRESLKVSWWKRNEISVVSPSFQHRWLMAYKIQIMEKSQWKISRVQSRSHNEEWNDSADSVRWAAYGPTMGLTKLLFCGRIWIFSESSDSNRPAAHEYEYRRSGFCPLAAMSLHIRWFFSGGIIEEWSVSVWMWRTDGVCKG